MKTFITLMVLGMGVVHVQALVISEVMSNPTGDDSGREWVEIYNDTTEAIDLTSMTISIKGGTAVAVTSLQGGVTLPIDGYAIIGSVVSGQTKFLQDYPSYAGVLMRSSMSLVNTGVTSLEVIINGISVASIPTYTAAKEGMTLSLVNGTYVSGVSTPGASNQAVESSETDNDKTGSETIKTESQVTVPQLSPPVADITLYLPQEKVVVAGADSEFTVFATTRAGKPINDIRYTWAFGDGGQSMGSSTNYRYAYPGRYVAHVEGKSSTILGNARMAVRVVAPDISIEGFGTGKYGSYIDIENPNQYDLDLSQWTLSIGGAGFPFPKNTLLPANTKTRFSGVAMGFASTTLATSTSLRILFPHLEEVTRYVPQEIKTELPVQGMVLGIATATPVVKSSPKIVSAKKTITPTPVVRASEATTTSVVATSSKAIIVKDTRILDWFKKLFGR